VPASVELVSVIVGFGLIAFAGARLGAGSHLSLNGLFAGPSIDAWPRGVQEGDVPHFAVEHAESLRHPAAPASPFEDLAADSPEAPGSVPVAIEVHRGNSRRDDRSGA
jgi:hypothetical protein